VSGEEAPAESSVGSSGAIPEPISETDVLGFATPALRFGAHPRDAGAAQHLRFPRTTCDALNVLAFPTTQREIDNLLFLPMFLPCSLVTGGAGPSAWLLYLAAYMVYFFGFELHSGQTLGKRAAGLRVVRADGGPVDAMAIGAGNVEALPYPSDLRSTRREVLALKYRVEAVGDGILRHAQTSADPPGTYRREYPQYVAAAVQANARFDAMGLHYCAQ
jgi:hypothetical protein